MFQIFKLKNQIKPYGWGSPEWIPGLLGHTNPQGEPWAELWMGVHPEGPSRVSLQGEDLLLSALISRDPVYYLGEGVNRTFGTLPFLYKLLAAAKPLSIQAHPSLEQAKEGWDRENRKGLALNAPERNYKDANHKPEVLCALSSFEAMCGFRVPGEIRRRLEALGEFCPPQSSLGTALDKLHSALDKPGGLKYFIRLLFNFPREVTEELTGVILQRPVLEKAHPEFKGEWRLSASFAELYPGDPALIAPLYLNCIHLNPGEAIYLPAGILHAYVHGFGVELMANSDNVLRGGLTPKHVDIDELIHILNFSPFCPEILKPPDPQAAFFNYPVPCSEFSLSFREGRGQETDFFGEGPFIFIATGGKAVIGEKTQGKKWPLEKGESVFIPAGIAAKGLSLAGTYTLYAAGVGAMPPQAEACLR
ncbi:MAG: mannose-6-phosphate isomerase, class I [Spirochaetaceae bacterium]|jgi:mannose-6-phosphate isomerase|nr:mannose-6-phosphate isomerase, class I [Spirochaetaceae bacterium]